MKLSEKDIREIREHLQRYYLGYEAIFAKIYSKTRDIKGFTRISGEGKYVPFTNLKAVLSVSECHGPLMNGPKRAEYVVTFFKGRKSKMKVRYLDWLLNESPYAPCFLDKNAEKCWSRRAVIHNTRVNAELLVGSCQSIRLMWKLGGHISIWNRLVNKGLHPSLSFVFCVGLRIGRVGKKFSLERNPTDEESCPVDSQYWTSGEVYNFLHPSSKQASFKTYFNRGTYRGRGECWDYWCSSPKGVFDLYDIFFKGFYELPREVVNFEFITWTGDSRITKFKIVPLNKGLNFIAKKGKEIYEEIR